MIDSARLERALIAVARRYAPALVPSTWANPGDYPYGLTDLARRLAAEGALVIGAEARPDVPDAALVYRDWADVYSSLYTRLCMGLFPSFTKVAAFYVDQAQPPIAVIQGDCAPVIAALGGFIAPYAAMRAGTRPSDMELRGILDMILDALEATDLIREDYIRLRDDCAAAVRRLLALPVRQIVITPAVRAILGETPSPDVPPTVREMPASAPVDAPMEAPPLPPTLPEAPNPPDADQPPALPPDAVPLFFSPSKRSSDDLPPPPVPPLPTSLPS